MIEFALQSALLALTAATVWWVALRLPEDDSLYIAKATVGFCLFRLLNPFIVAGPLFEAMKPDYDTKAERDIAKRKFGNHVNKFMMHVVLQAWGLQVLYNEVWFHGWFGILDTVWDGWDMGLPKVSGDVRDYYLVEMAFFLGSMIMQFVEARSHDHVAMLGHHYAAATLIATSYLFSCHRTGLFVLVSRELTDILIHSARALAFIHYKTPAELILVLLTILWVFSRCLYHPIVLCPCAWYSPSYEEVYHIWVTFNVLLMALVPLDYYYLYLALAAIVKRIKNPNLKNIDPDAPEAKKTN